MKTLELIKQYDLETEQENALRAQAKAEQIRKIRGRFLEFCTIWLGDLWDEFQPGELSHREDTGWSHPKIYLHLPLSFMNVPGELEGIYTLNLQQDAWSNLQLDFGHLDMGEHVESVYLSLGLKGTQTLVEPIDHRELGRLLSKVARHAPIREENARQRLEQARADSLVFREAHIPKIESEIERRVQDFPDLAEQIRAAGQAAIDGIKTQENERAQGQIIHKAQVRERERLEELAASAWKVSLTVYKINFGAFVGDGEGGTELCAESIYTISPDPDPEGYYLAFYQGKLSRRIRPQHKISTEILVVENSQDCPHDLKRWVDIKSREFPDVSVYTSLPPDELVAFDPEAI